MRKHVSYSQERYECLPDQSLDAGDSFQTPTLPIQMRTFDKSAYSSEYSSVPPHEPHSFANYPKQVPRYEAQPRNLAGWRAGAMMSALLASVSLLLNLGVGIWAWKAYGLRSALVKVFHGDCRNVQEISTLVHLGINAMSTALLSGSNYCMLCLSAPTRKDVDKAHAKGQWVDIGVPSVRNLRKISRKKVFLWWCLGLSSIPLQLMYETEQHAAG